VNVWLIGATVLMGGFLPCLLVAARASAIEALVALQLAGSTATLVLLLLSEGFHRPSYFAAPLVLSVLSFVGTLVIARFLARSPT
jgi:multisubunit Na+/H+ antiporter MnhF subunit